MTEAERHLAEADPLMRRLIAQVGPYRMRVARRESPYEALVRAVAYQQLHARAAESILGRLCGLFPPGRLPSAEELLTLDIQALRAVGFSASKATALLDIAQKTVDGVVPGRRTLARMSDEAIVERLVAVRGVGRWTVEMLLMFTLGRPDVLPVDDYGLRNGFRIAAGTAELPSRKALKEYGERWRPYRTAASWYLWRAVDGGLKT